MKFPGFLLVLALLASTGCVSLKKAEAEPEVEAEPEKVIYTVAEFKEGLKDMSVRYQQQVMVLVVANRSGGEQMVIFEEGIAATIVDHSRVGKIKKGQTLYVAGFYSGYLKFRGERYIFIKDAALLPETVLEDAQAAADAEAAAAAAEGGDEGAGGEVESAPPATTDDSDAPATDIPLTEATPLPADSD